MLWSYLTVSLLTLVGLFLIFIILLQRGRGGGLAGAFGGAGGQSALGTKAGDVFTRITIGLAVIWVLLACISIYALRAEAGARAKEFTAPNTLDSDDSAIEAAPTDGSKIAPGAAGNEVEKGLRAAGETTPSTTTPADADGVETPATEPPVGDGEPGAAN